MDHKSKTETLLYHANLSPDTVAKMKEVRRAHVALSERIETLGQSRELSLAFTAIEQSLYYSIKHLCMVDPQATLESVD